MVDLLEADKIAGVGFQDFRHQRLPVFPGMGTVLGQAEPEIKRHDRNRATGPVCVLFGDGYGGDLCHQDIRCNIPFRLSIVITSYSIHYTKLYESKGSRHLSSICKLIYIIAKGLFQT